MRTLTLSRLLPFLALGCVYEIVEGTSEPSTTEPSTTEPSTTEPTGEPSTTGAGAMIEIESGAAFASDCMFGDLMCGARAICEAVTGETCKPQNYDCKFAEIGFSYYPANGLGQSDLNFGAYAADAIAGNVCACDPARLAELGIPSLYPPCAEGGWRFVP